MSKIDSIFQNSSKAQFCNFEIQKKISENHPPI